VVEMENQSKNQSAKRGSLNSRLPDLPGNPWQVSSSSELSELISAMDTYQEWGSEGKREETREDSGESGVKTWESLVSTCV
jgi:hypothetical protein